jgi:uncharacterized membrane protein YfhO
LRKVNSADEEMKALSNLDTKKVAVFQTDSFTKVVSIQKFVTDTTATIQLTSYKPNHLKYVSNNTNDGLALFSEMYYKDGWNAYIDGKETSHFRANYALRAMNIPAGNHKIEFKFEPQVVKTGSTIALISSIGMLLAIAAGIYFVRKNN